MKEDFEAILGPGRHPYDTTALREQFVRPFNNDRRRQLFFNLTTLLSKLNEYAVACEVWIDGSFLTQKPEPNDIDLSVMVDVDVYDVLSDEGKLLLDELSFPPEKYLGCVDGFVCIVYPIGDPRRRDDPPEDWAKQWAIEHNERYLKGFVVLRVEP